jgi:hypothetical protein
LCKTYLSIFISWLVQDQVPSPFIKKSGYSMDSEGSELSSSQLVDQFFEGYHFPHPIYD